MQRKLRDHERGLIDSGEVVAERVSPIKYIPFLGVLAVIIAYGMWVERAELTQSMTDAKAYVYSNLLQQVKQPAGSTVSKPIAVVELPDSTLGVDQLVKADSGSATAGVAASSGTGSVIAEVTLPDNTTLQILDEPIPADCYPAAHSDYDGYAVKWGLGHKARSAAECCRMCKEFKPPDGAVPHPCNVWVWCGDPSGKCWTMDIHSHTTGDCWLKYQAGWDNNPDLRTSNLVINHQGRFPPAFRQEHKTAPEYVPWMAGVIPQAAASTGGGGGV